MIARCCIITQSLYVAIRTALLKSTRPVDPRRAAHKHMRVRSIFAVQYNDCTRTNWSFIVQIYSARSFRVLLLWGREYFTIYVCVTVYYAHEHCDLVKCSYNAILILYSTSLCVTVYYVHEHCDLVTGSYHAILILYSTSICHSTLLFHASRS